MGRYNSYFSMKSFSRNFFHKIDFTENFYSLLGLSQHVVWTHWCCSDTRNWWGHNRNRAIICQSQISGLIFFFHFLFFGRKQLSITDIFYTSASRNWIEIIDSCRITGQNFSITSSFSMYRTNFKIWKERIWRNRKTSHGRILFTRTFERNWIWNDSYAKTVICYQISWLDIIQTTPDPQITLLFEPPKTVSFSSWKQCSLK